MKTLKLISLVVIALTSIQSFAISTEKSVRTEILGRVTFEKNQSLTCMAIGCPPSQTYFQLSLTDVEVKAFGEFENVQIVDADKTISDIKPKFVVYGGSRLKEGQYVIIDADVVVRTYGQKTYAYVSNPVSVKLAPVRYPVMLY